MPLLHLLQVQQLLFFPTSYQMGLYSQLLMGDGTNPADMSIPANKMQAVALGHLWMAHGKCWERMRPFIEAGGLK